MSMRKLIERLEEAAGSEEKLNWGFDKMSFGSVKKWKAFQAKFGLKPAKAKGDSFRWTNASGDTEFVTQQDPMDDNDGRTRDMFGIGWVGYAGITGNPKVVKAMVKMIKQDNDDIKGESPNEREYI